MNNLERILARLKENEVKLDNIKGYERYIMKVMRAEKAERIKLNLNERQAKEHFNKWMKAAGLEHLIIK